jgi:hypothetical protein
MVEVVELCGEFIHHMQQSRRKLAGRPADEHRYLLTVLESL